jgi:hypothetical protein
LTARRSRSPGRTAGDFRGTGRHPGTLGLSPRACADRTIFPWNFRMARRGPV